MADLASLLPLIAPMICLLLGCVLFLVLLELFPLPGFIRTYRRRVREERDRLRYIVLDTVDPQWRAKSCEAFDRVESLLHEKLSRVSGDLSASITLEKVQFGWRRGKRVITAIDIKAHDATVAAFPESLSKFSRDLLDGMDTGADWSKDAFYLELSLRRVIELRIDDRADPGRLFGHELASAIETIAGMNDYWLVRGTLGILDFDDPAMLTEKPEMGLKHSASDRTGSYRVSPAG